MVSVPEELRYRPKKGLNFDVGSIVEFSPSTLALSGLKVCRTSVLSGALQYYERCLGIFYKSDWCTVERTNHPNICLIAHICHFASHRDLIYGIFMSSATPVLQLVHIARNPADARISNFWLDHTKLRDYLQLIGGYANSDSEFWVSLKRCSIYVFNHIDFIQCWITFIYSTPLPQRCLLVGRQHIFAQRLIYNRL